MCPFVQFCPAKDQEDVLELLFQGDLRGATFCNLLLHLAARNGQVGLDVILVEYPQWRWENDASGWNGFSGYHIFGQTHRRVMRCSMKYCSARVVT